jgi:hypothetical protein
MAPGEHIDARLAERARRAYERGRFVLGLRRTLPVALLVVTVAFVSSCDAWQVCIGAVAVLGAALATARGRLAARAARVGVMASLPSLAAPFVAAALHRGCLGCSGPSLLLCLSVCAAAGAIAGAATAGMAGRERAADRRRFTLTAALVAAGIGVVGCGFAGLAGAAGMAAGLLAGGAPVALMARSPEA